MKKLLTATLILISLQLVAQKPIGTTESFSVEGSVKQAQSFSLNDLIGLPVVKIDSVVILNHLLERKSAIKNVKGVLLKDVLSKLTIDQANPKLLSEYYCLHCFR